MTPDTTARPRIPIATYRLQFNRGFTFRAAHDIVDYLHGLGISDCYASSYLRAVPDSGHGYDIADPTSLNPEIGTDEEYVAWIDALRQAGMGHILDVVPNHMGIARSANPWWMDVLENGPSSRFARFFDIAWRPIKDELADKVLLPILGDYYGSVLEDQQFALEYQDGAFIVRYGEDWLPLAPDTYPRVLEAVLLDWQGGESESDELRSIVTAAQNLPVRSASDPQAIAVRSREKEIVKRRLASLVSGNADLHEAIGRTLAVFNGIKGQPRSFDGLDALLGEQSYRLSDWHVASEEINYRRFFDVNQLAALRVEDPAVFDEVHKFIFDLLARGAPTGLRIDHVDGLFAPADYLRRLQARAAEVLRSGTDRADRAVYLVVEKILGPGEQLPSDWPVHGTTGYEFAFVVNNLFVDTRHERDMDEIYSRFLRAGRSALSFDDLAYHSRKQIVHATMSGDINSLGHQLNRLSERNRHYRDFTLYSLIAAIKELIASFPVYRTYITGEDEPDGHDRRYVAKAVRSANRRAPGMSRVFDFIQRVLLKQTLASEPEEREERARFIGKFQQITSPVAAKGIEDTAFYVYNRLVSLNEVGGDPTRFGLEPTAVHAWLCERQRQWPSALSATGTHDSKRGEDVRARLNVLSEIPGAWKAAAVRWRALNRRFRTVAEGVDAPDANDEYLIYQTLVGAWPFTPEEQRVFPERLRRYIIKAIREAKHHTNWISPDERYEMATLRFVDDILDQRRPFFQAFLPFQARVAELGVYNSLAQLLIKITAPGVPDFYQGTELWDLSLVDPDNRRPVDYGRRRQVLQDVVENVSPQTLLDSRADGRIKMFVMARALAQRGILREVYDSGSFVPLSVEGDHRSHVFAFARRHADAVAITCVPRLVAGLLGHQSGPPVGAAVWGETRILLPWATARPTKFRDAITGAQIEAHADGDAAWLDASAVFGQFPAALLVPVG